MEEPTNPFRKKTQQFFKQTISPEGAFEKYTQEMELAEELGVDPIVIRFIFDEPWNPKTHDPAIAESVIAIVRGDSSPEREAAFADPATQKARVHLLKKLAKDLPKFISLMENS